jgi:RNA polymerase sigma-70 factor (ECF subfamily)
VLDKREKPSRFPQTHWSLIGRAAASDDMVRQQALSDLLTLYLPGLRAFLIEGRRVPADLADDLLHGFVADKVLGAGLVRHADRGRGKFRNFVLKSLNNYVTTRLQREYAARATAAGGEEALADLPCHDAGADRFEQEWVQQVVQDAIRLMEIECRDRGRQDQWEIFRLRVIDPMLHDADPVDYGVLVEQFGFETPRQAINLLANAKRCFTRHLRSAVAKYISRESEIDEEIADLRRIVMR